MKRVVLLAAALLVLEATGVAASAKLAGVTGGTDWRSVATAADRTRVRDWRTTWLAAVVAAQATNRAAVVAAGELLAADRALTDPIPPAGRYRCRTIKLGTKGASVGGGFIAYPWFECRVEEREGVIRFVRTTGSQRPVGTIFKDGTGRGIFLGTLVLGDESRVLDYGRDAARDMVGLVARIGPKRWRIGFPQPRFESQLDVMEIVPAG